MLEEPTLDPTSRLMKNMQKDLNTIRSEKNEPNVSFAWELDDLNTDRSEVEEKLAKSKKRKRGQDEQESDSETESSSSSEDEDEDAALATEALDSEILTTLNAIKSKDPRIYDGSTTFYTNSNETDRAPKEKKEKPMYLKDYHRENLLNGVQTNEEKEPLSYNQQQENLKKSIVSEMHAAADSSEDDSDSEGGLLVRKAEQVPSAQQSVTKTDVENADRDPETFLSNFMASRAWIPNDRSDLHPFESDDESDEDRAEKFEEAYNMRFEAPEKSNETLRSYSREFAEKHSVRREEKNARKKKREAEKAAKEAAKLQLKEEKARLKKLKLEEVQEKVQRIKRAAGLKSNDLQPEDWARFINDEWDDSKWEEEMQKRFGERYYAEQDELDEEGSDEGADASQKQKRKRKVHKPKFDDDIGIRDIIPDFEEDQEDAKFSLSDSEENKSKAKTKGKSARQANIDAKQESRRERRILSALIDDQMNLDFSAPAKTAGFRYRETSPQSFGLTAREILLADDSALNTFAGLKKLATFRDEGKKAKDRKHLGKKARLRKWRLDTFGNEDGPPEDTENGEAGFKHKENGRAGSDQERGGVDIREGERKKKRRRGKKAKTAATGA